MSRRLALCVLLSLAFSPACRQILALKHAHHDSAAGAAGSTQVASSIGVPTEGVSCETEPSPSCRACREMNCQGYDLKCATDRTCRPQVGNYAACLGRDCDKDAEGCLIDEVRNEGLRYCLETCNGNDACTRTSLLSICELYCGCMQQCPTQQQTDLGDCMEVCKHLPTEVTLCRRSHCEVAQAPGTSPENHVMHCQHANGTLEVCKSNVDLPKLFTCTSARDSTWGCEKASECCSRRCSDGVCD
jgi:hypothetical protein